MISTTAGGPVRTVDSAGRLVDNGRIVALRPPDLTLAAAVRDEWIEVGRRVGPTDRPVAERAVVQAYERAGLAPPRHVVWLGSPAAGVLACALLTPMLRARLVEEHPSRRSSPHLRGREAPGDLLGVVGAELVRQTGSDPADLSGARARRAVVDAALGEARVAVLSGISDVIVEWVDGEVDRGVATALAPTRRAHNEYVDAAISGAVPASVFGWTRGMSIDTGPSRLGASTLAVIDYAARLTGDAPGMPDRVAPLAVLASQVGMWWPMRDVAILTELPTRGDGPDGPVLVHVDGSEIPDAPPVPPPAGPRRMPPMAGDDGRPVVPVVGPLPPHVRDHPDLPALRERLVLGGLGPLVGELLADAAPAVRLVGSLGADRVGGSRIGGLPDLAPHQEWPTTATPDGPHRPLPFVAQLDLAELCHADPTGTLPTTGLLSFFLDLDLYVDRLDEADLPQPDGGWAVLHDDGTALSSRPRPGGLPDSSVLTAVPVAPRPELTLPDIDTDEFPGHVDDVHGDRTGLIGELSGRHQVLGHAAPVQADESDGRLLLLQLDEDPAAELDWGPGGRVYFYVHPDDLQARRFDRVHCVYQV